MPLTVAIHQPSYLPWPAFFRKMSACDIWVHLDDVQFRRRCSFSRALLKGPDGKVILTVPVVASRGSLICDVPISADEFSRKSHMRVIETLYGKAPHFDDYAATFRSVYDRQWDSLVELNLALSDLCCEALGIRCQRVRSSGMGIASSSSQRILDICRAVGADVYVSGGGGIRYMDMPTFRDASIEVQFQIPATPEYPQRYPQQGFIPGLSIIDALMNLGPAARDLVDRSGEVVDEATMRAHEAVRLADASAFGVEQAAGDDEFAEPWGL